MSCPVCSATMQNLGSPERRIWWCSRCGTLKEMSGDFTRIEMPSWLRRVAATANFDHPDADHVFVPARFTVDRFDDEVPRMELHVFEGQSMRRI